MITGIGILNMAFSANIHSLNQHNDSSSPNIMNAYSPAGSCHDINFVNESPPSTSANLNEAIASIKSNKDELHGINAISDTYNDFHFSKPTIKRRRTLPLSLIKSSNEKPKQFATAIKSKPLILKGSFGRFTNNWFQQNEDWRNKFTWAPENGNAQNTYNILADFEKPRVLEGSDGRLITPFFTRIYIFSNHFPCRFLQIDDVKYLCVEQFFMFNKALIFGDRAMMSAIMQETDPRAMKKLGDQIEGFDEHRWFPVSIQVMVIAQYHKYQQDPDLRKQLFETYGTVLAEASPYNDRWGIGLGLDDDLIRDINQWRGMNLMGRILMMLRDRLLSLPEFELDRKVYEQRYKAKYGLNFGL